MQKEHNPPTSRVLLEVKTSRTAEETPEAMVQFLGSLTNLKKPLFLYYIRLGIPVSLEISVLQQTIHFYVSIPHKYQAFIESQLISQYPKTLIEKTKDYLPDIVERESSLALGQLKLLYNPLYPIRTYTDFKEVDPMSSLLGALSKAQVEDKVALQILLLPVGNSWQRKGERAARDKHADSTGAVQTNPYATVIKQKIATNGFKTAIRVAVNSHNKERS